MRIDVVSDAEHPTLVLGGRFDAHEVETFRAAVAAHQPPAGESLRLDLAAVGFLDSTALAELLLARSQLRARDGELVLTAVSDPVRVILELTRLETVFTIADRDRDR